MSNEEWRDVVGYEGVYKISEYGKVVRIKSGKLIRPIMRKGYHSVTLCKDGKPKTFILHRLVALAFIPNPDGFRVVNHIDNDRLNNHYFNLEWCTHSHNNRHAYENGFRKDCGERSHYSKLSKEQVSEIRRLYNLGGITQRALGEMFGVNQTHISSIVNGIKWRFYQFKDEQ